MDNTLRRPNTAKVYKSLFNKWIVPLDGNMDEARFRRVVAYWLQEEQLAPRTVKTLIRLLRDEVAPLGVVLPWKEITTQVMKSVQDEEVKALTKEQSKALLEAAKGTELYIPILLGLHTGMRRGEVFGLKWADVDIFKREIKVQRSYNGPTKNGKNRIVPISPLLEQELLDFYTIKADNSSSKPVIPRQFDPNPGLRAACRRAGIEPISFHALRHTFATMALEAGRSPRKVQQVLGHSALSTTLNIYWSVGQEKLDTEFLK